MNTEMTRGMLRGLIDPTLIGELSQKPPFNVPLPSGRIVPLKGSWTMYVTQTILPFCRHQIRQLSFHQDLLTEREQDIVAQHVENVAEFERNWRSKPFVFPTIPDGFEDILRAVP